ncbi:MAG: abortive infection family protein [Cyclobacteriaceae bacterium]
MQSKNKISTITRRNIADELTMSKLWYHGRLKEADFLSRIYDLNSMPSTDYRPQFDNAYKDIYQHMDMNSDWEPDWVFTDSRFNLTHCKDEEYLIFLAETLHPAVRNEEVEKLLDIYNKHLEPDGYEIAKTDEISGKPIFTGRLKTIGKAHLESKKIQIKKYLDTQYVNNKINIMNNAVDKDTDLAIGTAKELLETTCASILKQKGINTDPNWNLSKLLNETTSALDFTPKYADNSEKAEKSIKQILKGISTIVHGVAELRNAYGTGHGKDADFKGLEPKYAKLLAGVISEIAIIYLATNGEAAELVEEPEIGF